MADVEMNIRLNDVHELFDTSNYDAFDPYSLQMPGLELFHDFLTPRPTSYHYRAIVYLPDEQVRPDLTAQVTDAVRRYATRQIHQDSKKIYQLRSEGTRTALAGSAVCLVTIGLLFSLSYVVASRLMNVLIPLGTIVMWVAIWRPTELLTFDQLPLRRSRRTWRRIINVPMEIRPLSQASPGQEFLNSYDGNGGWASADRR